MIQAGLHKVTNTEIAARVRHVQGNAGMHFFSGPPF